MQPEPPEVRRWREQSARKVQRELRRDRLKLFEALEEFANMRGDKDAWAQFSRRWPKFFPKWEYDRAVGEKAGPNLYEPYFFERVKEEGGPTSISDFPFYLNQIWMGGESQPYLDIMFGIRPTPGLEDVSHPEESAATGMSSIPPAHYSLDWREGTIRYEGGCDFQRALYLLFRESWRARICAGCGSAFVAKRPRQKYHSTDCSEAATRQSKLASWNKHGDAWRQNQKDSKAKKKGKRNVSNKAR